MDIQIVPYQPGVLLRRGQLSVDRFFTKNIQWNPALRPPRFYGNFFLAARQNDHTISLAETLCIPCLVRTVLGEYRPSIFFVRNESTVKSSGRYSPSTALLLAVVIIIGFQPASFRWISLQAEPLSPQKFD